MNNKVEWVDLTDEELDELQNRGFSKNDWMRLYTLAAIAKFKEKNTPSSVEAMRIETLDEVISALHTLYNDYEEGLNEIPDSDYSDIFEGRLEGIELAQKCIIELK